MAALRRPWATLSTLQCWRASVGDISALQTRRVLAKRVRQIVLAHGCSNSMRSRTSAIAGRFLCAVSQTMGGLTRKYS